MLVLYCAFWVWLAHHDIVSFSPMCLMLNGFLYGTFSSLIYINTKWNHSPLILYQYMVCWWCVTVHTRNLGILYIFDKMEVFKWLEIRKNTKHNERILNIIKHKHNTHTKHSVCVCVCVCACTRARCMRAHMFFLLCFCIYVYIAICIGMCIWTHAFVCM